MYLISASALEQEPEPHAPTFFRTPGAGAKFLMMTPAGRKSSVKTIFTFTQAFQKHVVEVCTIKNKVTTIFSIMTL